MARICALAAARLREALGLWSGPPLSDFAYEAFAQGEIARLEEARLAALEDRIDADLALGRHDRLVPELELVAREHPLRERLCAQRMLAHHFLEAGAAGTPGKAIGYARGAAERAVSALAYEEAVRLYQMTLEAHGRAEPPDAMVRCELLLALGDAQTRAGDTPAAKETFLLAAGPARHTAAAMARAALGYGGRFLFNVSRDDPRLRPLLEEALADLGTEDSALRAMLLARLAGARYATSHPASAGPR